jgi:homopolymeric O-antigen transport system ATP-binding protein
MPTAVTAEGLGKRYVLGNTLGGYSRLTEDISDLFSRILRRPLEGRIEATRREIWALEDATLDIDEGEIVGLVGRNGAGKTTLLKVMARITEPTTGRAVIRGRVGSLLEVGTGFHPELTGRENVFLNGAILGMRRGEIRASFDDIIAFAELERFVDTPVKRYSSGMYVRLAFAVAAYLTPEILFVDEVLSVGDQAFQQRCIGRMGEIAHSGRTIVFVSHNLASISALCTRGVLLEQGRIVRDGPVDDIIDHYVKSVQTLAGELLENRKDREGNGRLKVTRVDFAAADGGPPRTGSDGRLTLDYESEIEAGDVSISIAIEGPLGEAVFYAANSLTGEKLTSSAPAGELVCDFPALKLLPGRYSLTFYIEVSGRVADWVRHAMYFDVFEADVFGTGQLPPGPYGRIVIDQRWSSGHAAS